MKKVERIYIITLFTLSALSVSAQVKIPHSFEEDKDSIMSKRYWEIWNPKVQSSIDADIDAYRKADANIEIKGLKQGTEVKIEQLTSDFYFGAHIFNFDQLGKKEYNDTYKNLYGTLFNSATIAFYWRTLETEPGRIRFEEEYWDTEQWWNNCTDPKKQPHWRRPPTDKVVEFCKSKGIRTHGHPLIYCAKNWHHPNWLYNFVPDNEKSAFDSMYQGKGLVEGVSIDTFEANLPEFGKEFNRQFELRIQRIAEKYKDIIDGWDVVNESAVEYNGNNDIRIGKYFMNSIDGLMPADFPYKAFKNCQKYFPQNVKLYINDYMIDTPYLDEVKSLQERGCRIDVLGTQMHLFNPQQCLDIANGLEFMTPDELTQKYDLLSRAGLPLHLSEITLTSPTNDSKGEMIQAIITRNLYRKWFSIEKMMGITWWNVVDECGAPGETSVSGLFHRDMTPKASYYALKELILDEFRTNTTIVTTKKDIVSFRGFKGNYRITWTDEEGQHILEYHLQ